MEIQVIPQKGKNGTIEFVKAQWKFYEGDPNFVPPVVADRMKLFDKKKNPFYQHADRELFIAKRDGEIVGRIAAITNENHNKTHNDNMGFFGFYECIDDQTVSDALFDASAEWLKQRGKDAMRGPIDPSLNDECGLLIKGFDDPPRVLMKYNPPFYDRLIKGSGFEKAKDLYAYHLRQQDYMNEKLIRLQGIIRKRHNIEVRNVEFKNREQFRKDVQTLKDIYNKAWVPNWGFVKMTDAEFDFLAADLKQFAEPSLAFIVSVNGKPAGFALGLPDINRVLIHNKKGSLLGALWHLLTKRKQIDWMRIIVLGVVPEYQKTGVDAVMYYEFGERAANIGIYNCEASWVLEDNEMMNKGLTVTLKGERYKEYRIYEKKISA
ncbi:MAG: hypothetical protein ACLFR2_03455 [Candidatus Kapaibacterium sp.]